MTALARCCYDHWGNHYSAWWWVGFVGVLLIGTLATWAWFYRERHKRRRRERR